MLLPSEMVRLVGNKVRVEGKQLVTLHFFFHIERKKLLNLGSGLVPNSLMVRGYEPGREDIEFDPRLGNFFLSILRSG